MMIDSLAARLLRDRHRLAAWTLTHVSASLDFSSFDDPASFCVCVCMCVSPPPSVILPMMPQLQRHLVFFPGGALFSIHICVINVLRSTIKPRRFTTVHAQTHTHKPHRKPTTGCIFSIFPPGWLLFVATSPPPSDRTAVSRLRIGVGLQ